MDKTLFTVVQLTTVYNSSTTIHNNTIQVVTILYPFSLLLFATDNNARPYTAALREMVLDVAMRDLSPYSKYSPKNIDSLASIARRYHISESTIRRWINAEKEQSARLYGTI